MKFKTFTTLFAFCWGTLLFSQVPFPENDAVWREGHLTIAGQVIQYYALCGDTIIDNINYNKVLNLQVDSALNIVGETYAGAVRSDGEFVRFKPNYMSDEYVLYDFSLEAGDVIDLYPLYSSQTIQRTVESTDVELLAGKMRKVIYFEPGFPGATVEYWIEGIGSSFGLLGRAQDIGGDIGSELLCFSHGPDYLNLTLIECFLPELGDCPVISATDDIYAGVDFFVSPNPASEDIRIVISGENYFSWNIEVLGLDGVVAKKVVVNNSNELLLDISDQPSGVYFIKIWDGGYEKVLGVEKIIISRK